MSNATNDFEPKSEHGCFTLVSCCKDIWFEWWFIWVDCDVINGNARFEDELVLWNCMVAIGCIEKVNNLWC